MNLVEFFNKTHSLKGECLPDIKKFCFTIIQVDKDNKAVKTVKHYISLSAGALLFEDIVTERFWTSKIRYPEGYRERKTSGKKQKYRDLLITLKGVISVREGESQLLFNLTPFELGVFANTLLSYLKAQQLAFMLQQKKEE